MAQKVFAVIDNTCIDYDDSRSGLVGVFTHLSDAKKCLKSRAESYDVLRDEWHTDNSDDEWEISETCFRIWEDGYFTQDHICITIEETILDENVEIKSK